MKKYNYYLDINFKDRTSEVEALYEPTLKDIKADPEMYAELVNDLLFHWIYGTRETPLMVMVKKQMKEDKMAKGGVPRKRYDDGGTYDSQDFEDWIYENHQEIDIHSPQFQEFMQEHYQNMLSHQKNFRNLKGFYKMADGGVMAKGGDIDKARKDINKIHVGQWVEYLGLTDTQELSHKTIREKALQKRIKEYELGKLTDLSKYADGGMMAAGGSTEMAKGGMPRKRYDDGGTYGDGGFFGLFSKNKLKVGDILLINPYNLPPMRNGSQYFKVLPSTKLRVEKITDDYYFIRRIGIDEGSVNDLNQYNKEDIDTFLKESRLIKSN